MSSQDRVFYIGATVSRDGRRFGSTHYVSCFHSALYHGWQRTALKCKRAEAVEPELAINAAVLGLRLPGTSAIVSPQTADALAGLVRGVTFSKPNVTLAFYRVVDPSDGLEGAFIGTAHSPRELLDEYVLHHWRRVAVPDVVHVVPAAAGSLAAEYPEARELRVPIPGEGRDVYLEFSREMVHKFGLLWSYGLLCSPAVFEVFASEVTNNPYFAVVQV